MFMNPPRKRSLLIMEGMNLIPEKAEFTPFFYGKLNAEYGLAAHRFNCFDKRLENHPRSFDPDRVHL